MTLYRFYRFDRTGRPLSQVDDIQCGSDLQARFKGREILATGETVESLDIWPGERRVVRLAQSTQREALSR